MIMRKEAGGDWAELTRVPFNTTTYHNTPLASGKTFTYMVHAVKGDATSNASNEVMVTIL